MAELTFVVLVGINPEKPAELRPILHNGESCEEVQERARSFWKDPEAKVIGIGWDENASRIKKLP